MSSKEFKTTDLYLITYLLCKGHKPVEKPFLEDNLFIFLFTQSQELQTLVKDFQDYNAPADALTLLEYHRRVKSILWNLRKKAGDN